MATIVSTPRALPMGPAPASVREHRFLKENWRIAAGVSILVPLAALAVGWRVLPLPAPRQRPRSSPTHERISSLA